MQNGSEIWGGATTQVIRWSYSGNPGPYVKIELMKAGVLNRVLTAKARIGTKGNGSYSWYIPCEQPSAGDYTIRVTSTANSAYSAVSRNFTIKGAGIGVVAPVGGEQWKTNESGKLQWSYAGCAGSYVRIELLKNGVSSLIQNGHIRQRHLHLENSFRNKTRSRLQNQNHQYPVSGSVRGQQWQFHHSGEVVMEG
jgi:hypothetical protein